MVPEAVEASRLLAPEGILANVLVLTSPRQAFEAWRNGLAARLEGGVAVSWLGEWISPEEVEGQVPIVSVVDGHPHALAWLGTALGVPHAPLGVHGFGQSGARADLYRHYQIDAEAIARAARLALA